MEKKPTEIIIILLLKSIFMSQNMWSRVSTCSYFTQKPWHSFTALSSIHGSSAAGCAELASPRKAAKPWLKGYRDKIHIISLLTDSCYSSSQYLTICCSHNSCTALFWLAMVLIYCSRHCRNAEKLLMYCSILLLAASHFRLLLPLLMYCGGRLPSTSLGVLLAV